MIRFHSILHPSSPLSVIVSRCSCRCHWCFVRSHDHASMRWFSRRITSFQLFPIEIHFIYSCQYCLHWGVVTIGSPHNSERRGKIPPPRLGISSSLGTDLRLVPLGLVTNTRTCLTRTLQYKIHVHEANAREPQVCGSQQNNNRQSACKCPFCFRPLYLSTNTA